MNNKQSVLVQMGLSIAITGIAYTPTPKPKPSADVVSKYVTTHTSRYKYSPLINGRDWERSEARKKELLADIRGIKQQIREEARKMRIEADHGAAHKLIENICCNIMENTKNKEKEILFGRAKEIKVPVKLLNRDIVLARKGIISIELV